MIVHDRHAWPPFRKPLHGDVTVAGLPILEYARGAQRSAFRGVISATTAAAAESPAQQILSGVSGSGMAISKKCNCLLLSGEPGDLRMAMAWSRVLSSVQALAGLQERSADCIAGKPP